MRFLVTSLDAVTTSNGVGRYKSANEYFPQIVQAEFGTPYEDIVGQCFRDDFKPRHNKQYLVIALEPENTKLVTFKRPQPQYDVEVMGFS